MGEGCKKEREMSSELLTGRTLGARKAEAKANGKKANGKQQE